MTNPERFMLVAFTQNWAKREQFNEWPQHMTVMPWLSADIGSTMSMLTEIANDYEPLITVVAERGMYGANNDVPVYKLGPVEVFKGLHQVILSGLRDINATLEDETYVDDKYSPHMAIKAGQPDHYIGDEIVFSSISLISKIAEQKTILHNVNFKDL